MLSEVFLDLPCENDDMVLGEFDGFVAGILVYPEMIMPWEWVPLIWVGDHHLKRMQMTVSLLGA